MSNSAETMTTPRSALPNTFTNISAREIDFVTRFGKTWDSLREIMGIMRPIKKEDGTTLVSYTASVTLEGGDVPAGAIIPYSKATVVEAAKADVALRKYAKAVTIEDVNAYGVKVAVQKTDEAFRDELQGVVLEDFYTFLTGNTSALTDSAVGFQAAVAKAIGLVKDKFKKMRKNSTNIVVFANTLDVYDYLGTASISLQTAFGIDYVKNFLGATSMIVTSEIDPGSVIAIPAENIDLYYVDPASAFNDLGLVYTVEGETNLIGYHTQGNYGTAVGESYALMGLKLWLEYADGEAIVAISSGE